VTAGERAGETFEEFYSKRCPQLKRAIVAWTGDVQLAEDISHEVMLILMHCWGKYSRPDLLMFRVAKQQIGRVRKKEPRRSDQLDKNLERVEEHLERSNGTRLATESDSHIDLMRLVSSLPDRQRDVLVLTVISDLPDLEAGRILGVSVSSVKTHRQRGLDALRRALVSTGPSGE
jgi:RNA polymerase sigma factor (sigma-70 family)